MKYKDFYEELCKAGFSKSIYRMFEYKKRLGLNGYNIEDIPLYLNHSNQVDNKPNIWLGKHLPEIARKKMSIAKKGKFVGVYNNFYGKHHSEETKQMLSSKLKGRKPWNKGLNNVYSEETLQLMHDAKNGIPLSIEHRMKLSEAHHLNPIWLGKHHSIESRKKISESLKEYYKTHISPNMGCIFPREVRLKLSHAATARAKLGLRQSIKYNGLSFDSKWEIIFYEYWKKRGAVIERNIECELPSGRHTLIDFRINGKLYEIKGPHFFNKQGEYIIPFNNPNKIQDEHSREKQQYWKDNNVIVVSDIKPYK